MGWGVGELGGTPDLPSDLPYVGAPHLPRWAPADGTTSAIVSVPRFLVTGLVTNRGFGQVNDLVHWDG